MTSTKMQSNACCNGALPAHLPAASSLQATSSCQQVWTSQLVGSKPSCPCFCGLIQVAAVLGTAQLLYHPSEHAPMLSVCHCGAACTPEQQSACTCRPGAPLVANAVVWHMPKLECHS